MGVINIKPLYFCLRQETKDVEALAKQHSFQRQECQLHSWLTPEKFDRYQRQFYIVAANMRPVPEKVQTKTLIQIDHDNLETILTYGNQKAIEEFAAHNPNMPCEIRRQGSVLNVYDKKSQQPAMSVPLDSSFVRLLKQLWAWKVYDPNIGKEGAFRDDIPYWITSLAELPKPTSEKPLIETTKRRSITPVFEMPVKKPDPALAKVERFVPAKVPDNYVPAHLGDYVIGGTDEDGHQIGEGPLIPAVETDEDGHPLGDPVEVYETDEDGHPL